MTETATDQKWVNKPQQARSRETMNLFVVAAETLLRQKTFDEITIGEIVEQSDRTVGSFYARFDDKWGLLRTVVHRYLEQVRSLLGDLLDPNQWVEHPVSEMISVTVHASVGLYRAHGHIFRAGLAFAATDDLARQDMVKHQTFVRELIGNAILRHPDITNEPDTKRRIDLALDASAALLDTRVVYSTEWRQGDVDWDGTATDIEQIFSSVSGIRI